MVLVVICKSCYTPSQSYLSSMVRRTYESDADKIEYVDNLDDLVADKREAWRATSDNVRRRQGRYKKHLTNRLVRQDYYEGEIE